MATDTYAQVWNNVLLRCPGISPKLAQNFVVNGFRRIAEKRRWSWLIKFNQFICPDAYTTGTVTLTLGSTNVVGSGTTWTSAMVGRQFRAGLNAPIYTIAAFNSATSIDLDLEWGSVSVAGTGYQIYQCYFTPPDDFHQFVCLWDPAFNWQLALDVQQSEINAIDAQRANIGNSYVVSFRDYTSSMVGTVAQPLEVSGTGNIPTSAGTYTGPSNAIFTVEVTTTGTPGTAVFKWKKNSGSYTTGVTTDAAGDPQDLQDGVTVSFPTGFSYTSGNIFVIRATAGVTAGLPRYELWPAQQSAHVYPYLYEARCRDINEPGSTIPRYIRGDVIMEMGLYEAAWWPGTQTEPNPYFNLAMAAQHLARADEMIRELAVQDDEVFQQQIQYQYPGMGFPMAVPWADSRWLQAHSI